MILRCEESGEKAPLLILAHQRTDGAHDTRNLVKRLEGKVVVVERDAEDEGEDGDEEHAVESNVRQ